MSRKSNTETRRQRREGRAERAAGVAPRRPGPQRQRVGGGGLPIIGSISGMTLAIIGGGAFILAILLYVVVQANSSSTSQADWQKAQLDDSTSLPGEYIPPHPGQDGQLGTGDDRQHFTPGTVVPICTQAQLDSGDWTNPLCYQSNPPTSGPHSSTPMPFQILQNPAPKENLIHNMEHGGVVVWYNTTDQAVIDQLKKIVQDHLDRRQFVVMSAYSGMEPNTVALTAWTRLDKFSATDLTKDRVDKFIDAHNKRFNPEGF